LYRDTRKNSRNLQLDGKNRAMLRSFRLVPGLYPDEKFAVTTFIRSATPTNFIAGPLWASH
jgi:hypothetical protein